MLARRVLRFTDGNRVITFENGFDGLASMLEAIRGAQERVHLETYILRADAVGRRFLEALESRARDGVEVRLLFDSLGSRHLDRRALELHPDEPHAKRRIAAFEGERRTKVDRGSGRGVVDDVRK